MFQRINIPNLAEQLNEKSTRIETGALQVNDDWPMFVMRGDDALNFNQMVEILNTQLTESEKDRVRFALDYLNGIKQVIREEVHVKTVMPNDKTSI